MFRPNNEIKLNKHSQIQQLLRVKPEVSKVKEQTSTEELLIRRNPSLGSYNSQQVTFKPKLNNSALKAGSYPKKVAQKSRSNYKISIIPRSNSICEPPQQSQPTKLKSFSINKLPSIRHESISQDSDPFRERQSSDPWISCKI